MNLLRRPLAGCVLGLSISGGEDTLQRGFPDWQINRVTLQIVASLFGQGAGIVFGHDWRDDGVMEAVHGLALQMQPPTPLTSVEGEEAGRPLLQNILPWPDKPSLPQSELDRLASTLLVEEVGLPANLVRYLTRSHPSLGSDEYDYVRARGLTFLRHRLNDLCHARLCLGGRRSESQGRYPGVIEEAFLMLDRNKPVYLAGLLGGATRQLIDAIEGKQCPDDFGRSRKVARLFATPPAEVVGVELEQVDDRLVDAGGVWSRFQETGVAGLSRVNRLSEDENRELFDTPVTDRVIQLVLVGLSRLYERQ